MASNLVTLNTLIENGKNDLTEVNLVEIEDIIHSGQNDDANVVYYTLEMVEGVFT